VVVGAHRTVQGAIMIITCSFSVLIPICIT
jgi:hypothetical protein